MRAAHRRVSCVAALVALCGAWALAQSFFASPASAGFPGRNGKIAFVNSDLYDVVTVNPDGTDLTNITQVTGPSGDDIAPAWSPDGTKIAFASNRDGGGDSEIFVMDANGSNITQLTNNAVEDIDPSYSHDGARMVFVHAGEPAIMDADGTDLVVLNPFGTFANNPEFSPDDTKIAYSAYNEYPAPSGQDIHVIAANGTYLLDLTDDVYAGYADTSPSWSPDGTKIVFSTGRYAAFGGGFEVAVKNADDSGPTTKLTTFGNAYFTLDPHWGASGRIVFLGLANGGSTIFTMDGDGQNMTQLSVGFTPAISPDGSQIAFHSYASTKDIFVMNSDGSEVQRLIHDSTYEFRPAWSADGLHVAYSKYDSTTMGIVVADPDGSNPVMVVDGPYDENDPTWSPDGAWFAYDSYHYDIARSDIYKISSDGTGTEVNLTNDDAFDSDPSWSPDGTKIAFVSTRDDIYGDIYVMDADGSHITHLAGTPGEYEYGPQWSPDGTKIAYTENHGYSSADIFIIDPDGSDGTQLTATDGFIDADPAWAPDGTELAFVRTACNEDFSVCTHSLAIMNADGSDIRTIVSGNYPGHPSWQPLPITGGATSTVVFPGHGSAYGGSGWNAGCGTASVGDICGTAADTGGGIHAVQLSIRNLADNKYWDGSSFNLTTETFFNATGTTNWSFPFAAGSFPEDSRYSIHARAVDNNGVAESSPIRTFVFDTVPGISPITFPASGGLYGGPGWAAGCGTASTADICGTATDNNGAGIQTVQVALWSDAEQQYWGGSAFDQPAPRFFDAVGTTNWSFAFDISKFPHDGLYIAQARSIDKVGNIDPNPSGASFTVDVAAPTTPVAFPVAGGAYDLGHWNVGCSTASTGDMCGTASDATTGVHTAQYSVRRNGTVNKYWDGTAFTATNETFFNATGTTAWSTLFPFSRFPADGSYTMNARGVDNAGNVAAGSTVNFTIISTSSGRCGTRGVYTDPNTCTYSSATNAGFEDTFEIPLRVSSLHVVAVGGKGGQACDVYSYAGYATGPATGGFGASVTADVPAAPLSTLLVELAGNGQRHDCTAAVPQAAGGFNGGGAGSGGSVYHVKGGGGGGATDLRTESRTSGATLDSRVLVASGGGGGGGVIYDHAGYGGDGDEDGTDGSGSYGCDSTNGCYPGGKGGKKGIASAAGAGGIGSQGGATGSAGTFGTGGTGAADSVEVHGTGGGGGGGWYGGGGGGSGGGQGFSSGGGGGGGASHTVGAAQNVSVGVAAVGSPSLVITWVENLDDQAPTTTVDFPGAGASGWFTSSPATGTVTADDSLTGGSNVTGISCVGADVGTITGLGSPLASAPITVSDEGVTEVSCTATDSATNDGNTGTANTATVRIDSVKPVITPDSHGYVADTWTNADVDVDFTCADVGAAASGVVTDTVAGDTVSDETDAGSVTNSGECTDVAGNSADASTVSPIKIDRTAPVITADSGGYAAGDWTNSDVVVGFTCADAGAVQSGIETDTVAGATVSSETTAGSVTNTGSCVDAAGNTADSSTVSPIMIDKTSPVISATSGGYVADTWTNQSVTVSFSCAEVGAVQSGLATNTVGGGGTQSSDTSNGSFTSTGACTDAAGNNATSATFSPIKVDKTRPVVTANSGGYVANTWTNQSVTVSFSCADAGTVQSGLVANTVGGGGTQSSETSNGSFTSTGSCTDAAGNTAGASTFGPIKVDKRLPVITAASGGYAAGTWTNQSVVVSFSCAEVGAVQSGLATNTVGGGGTQSSDTSNGSFTSTGACTDAAGNSAVAAAFGPIMVDKTRPVITANSGGYAAGTWTNQSVTVSFSCADTGSVQSGLFADTVGGGGTQSTETSSGGFTNTGGCTDLAGNNATGVTFSPIKVDKRAPAITANSGGYAAGTWTNQSVVVSFSCAEVGAVQSGLGSNNVGGGGTQSADTSNGSFTNTGGCADVAGNTASPATFSPIMVDKTAPSLAIASVTSPLDGFMPAQTFLAASSSYPAIVGASPVTASGSAGDGGSGLATVTVNGAAATGTGSWSKTGVALASTGSSATVMAADVAGNTTSLVAATLQLDLDADGIANNVDGNSTVTPAVSQATTPSARFSDKARGGATSGLIKSTSGGATVTVADASPGGLSVVVGGSGQAKFTIDGKAGTINVNAPGTAILTDPPFTTELTMLVGEGTIEYLVNGELVVVGVAEGATAVIVESYTSGTLSALNVTQPSGDPGEVTVNGTPVGLATMTAKLSLSANKFDLTSTLTLGSGGVVTLPEDVVFRIGSYTATIPASALKKNKQGYAFTRTVNGVALSGLVTKVSATQYTVKVTGTGTNNIVRVNPIAVSVAIGNDSATTSVKAKLS
jgi:Tol biopolymer transport system component